MYLQLVWITVFKVMLTQSISKTIHSDLKLEMQRVYFNI